MTVRILVGDCRDVLRTLGAASAHTCVTSIPYYGKRDYGVEPTLWGGDPGCAHDFDREVHDRSRRSPGTQNGSLTGDGRYQAEAKRFETRSHFCRCGAWRGCLGLEPDWRMYVENVVEVFREVARVLRPDGTLWLNVGDSYATGAGKVGEHPGGGEQGAKWAGRPEPGKTSWAGPRGEKSRASRLGRSAGIHTAMGPMTQPNRLPQAGMKPKDMMGIPWRVAFALQDDGWWLRDDVIWSKPNPMPESTTDRTTKAHEYLFLLARSERYYFDQEAIKEDVAATSVARLARNVDAQRGSYRVPGKTNGPMKAVRARGNAKTFRGGSYVNHDSFDNGAGAERDSTGNAPNESGKRNKRSVWTISTKSFSGEFCRGCRTYFEGETLRALRVEKVDLGGERPELIRHCSCGATDRWLSHFATFPPELVEDCVKAGCPPGGTVLEPFAGAATTGMVADRLGRNAVLIELNPDFAEMGRQRVNRDGRLFGAAEIVEAAQ